MIVSEPVDGIGIEGRWLNGGPPSGRRFMRGLLPAITGHPDRAARVVVFDRGRHPLSDLQGVQFKRLRSMPAPVFNALQIQLALPSYVQAVLYQSFTPPFSRAARATVIHDLIYLSRPDLFTTLERSYFRLLPKLLPRAEVVVTVSEHVRAEILERFPARTPETVRVVPNGVDDCFRMTPEQRAVASDNARKRLGLEAPYVAAVGRRNPRKNLARLVRAFASAGLDGVELVLAGPTEGPRDVELERAIRGAGKARVRELGEVSDEALPWIYAGAECVCYVSLAEGFGIPPLEAMATGTPVVASSIASLREVLGDSAVFVDPLDEDELIDALRSVVTSPGLRDTLAERGRRQASQYTWAASAGLVLEALSLASQLRGTSRADRRSVRHRGT